MRFTGSGYRLKLRGVCYCYREAPRRNFFREICQKLREDEIHFTTEKYKSQ
jgi:hypothetical protein